MYTFTTDLNKKEYDKFVENYSMASFMQQYEWANVKDNWGSIHCGLYKDKKLVGVCTILIKKILKKLCLFYIPRGYLIDYTNYEDLEEMTKNIKKLAKEKHAYVVKIDPNFCITDNSFKDEEVEHNYSKDYELKNNNILKLGYKNTGINKEIGKNFQPQYQVFAPTCDINSKILEPEVILKKCRRIKPYVGNYQEKRGVSFEITQDINKIDDLVYLLKQTEKKQNINLRSKEYFVKIFKEYKEQVYLVFGNINLNIYKSFLENNDGTQEALDEVNDLIKENGDSMLLSGALVIMPKNKKGIRTSEYLYAGNNLKLTKLCASAALVFEIIKFSIKENCHYCNLGGIDGNLNDNLTIFKRKFDGRIMEFAGEYDLPISWIYYPITKLYPLLIKIYKKIR